MDMISRKRGRRPNSDKSATLTYAYKDGCVQFRRQFYRRLCKMIKKDKELKELVESGAEEWKEYEEVLGWARTKVAEY